MKTPPMWAQVLICGAAIAPTNAQTAEMSSTLFKLYGFEEILKRFPNDRNILSSASKECNPNCTDTEIDVFAGTLGQDPICLLRPPSVNVVGAGGRLIQWTLKFGAGVIATEYKFEELYPMLITVDSKDGLKSKIARVNDHQVSLNHPNKEVKGSAYYVPVVTRTTQGEKGVIVTVCGVVDPKITNDGG